MDGSYVCSCMCVILIAKILYYRTNQKCTFAIALISLVKEEILLGLSLKCYLRIKVEIIWYMPFFFSFSDEHIFSKLQINTSEEDTKSGVNEDEAEEIASHILSKCPHLKFAGLMTIGKSQLHT